MVFAFEEYYVAQLTDYITYFAHDQKIKTVFKQAHKLTDSVRSFLQ